VQAFELRGICVDDGAKTFPFYVMKCEHASTLALRVQHPGVRLGMHDMERPIAAGDNCPGCWACSGRAAAD
jgi:hypothetical protein